MISKGRVAPPGRGLTTNRVVFGIGILCALLAFGGVLYILNNNSQPSTQVVVASSDLTAGATLDSGSVGLASVNRASVPTDAITDPAQVYGKVLAVGVRQNTPITRSLLVGSSSSGGIGTAHLDITPGYVTVAIPANYAFITPPASEPYMLTGGAGDLVSAGFYIQPEDHIDILIAVPSPSNGPTIKYAFQDVRVLKVGDSGGAQSGSGQSAGAPSTFLVEVPRGQAPSLAALTTVGCNSAHPTSSDCLAPQVVRYVLRPTCENGDRNYKNDVKTITGMSLDQINALQDPDKKAAMDKLAAACKFPYPNYQTNPADVTPQSLQGTYQSP